MPTRSRTLLIPLPTLVLGACFDPMVDPVPGDGSTSSAASDGVDAGSATGTDATGTDDEIDGTGPLDAPPVLTAFTVQSSTMPAEVQVAGLIAFDVDATDDIGIDRVEVYDGDTLVTTTTEIPYVTKLLVTSADNGTHLYSAIAYDTSGQTAHSDPVPLSVNVVGGEILEIREDVADFRVSYALSSFPRVVVDAADKVTIVTTTREDVPMDPRFGLSAISYTDTLSLVWSDTRLPSEVGPYVSYLNAGKPVYHAQLATWWTGLGTFGPLDSSRAVATIDTAAKQIASIDAFGPTELFFMSPVAIDSTGEIILAPDSSHIQKLPTLGERPTWTIPLGDEAGVNFTDIAVMPDDSIIVVFAGTNGCLPEGSHCVYKLSSSGDVLWTRTGPTTSTALTLAMAISAEGHVAVAGSSDGPARLLVFDTNGDTITDTLITGEPIHDVRDLVYDAQGLLVAAGERRIDFGDREAWAGRFDEQGDPIWFHVYELGSERGITGLATNPKGKLFAVGWEDRFELDLAGWSGSGWIAEIAL